MSLVLLLVALCRLSLTNSGIKCVTDEHLDGFDCALQMLATNPDLLRDIAELSGVLNWYRVNQHI
jgi:hypothetical protein